MVVKKIFIFLVLICFATQPLAAMDHKRRSDSSLRHRVSAAPEMAKKPASCPSSVDASWHFDPACPIPTPQKMVDGPSDKKHYKNQLGVSWELQNEEAFQTARQNALDEQSAFNRKIKMIRGSSKRPNNDQRGSPLSECYGILARILSNIVSDER